MKTLDELEEIKELVNNDKHFKYKNIVNFNCESIEESIKALEIIKEYQVDVFRFKKLDFNTFNQLQKSCKLPELIEEEFSLLKEVLE